MRIAGILLVMIPVNMWAFTKVAITDLNLLFFDKPFNVFLPFKSKRKMIVLETSRFSFGFKS